jgi:SAM-dependent methyltransferase
MPEQSDAEILAPHQGVGAPPPGSGLGPPCSACGAGTWIEVGGGSAVDAYHPNIDVRKLPGVDVVHDLESGTLPFHDAHASRVKMIHSLNHLRAVTGRKILGECLRVLAPGGSLYVMVTDVEFVAKQVAATGLRECWASCLWGTRGDTYEADFHYWGYTRESLQALLLDVGFKSVIDRGPYNAWEFKMEAEK